MDIMSDAHRFFRAMVFVNRRIVESSNRRIVESSNRQIVKSSNRRRKVESAPCGMMMPPANMYRRVSLSCGVTELLESHIYSAR